RSRRTQFLCGLHKKRRDSALPDFADVLLRRSHQLAVGHYRDLCNKQGRGRQSVCVRLFATEGCAMNYFIKRDPNEYGPYSLADLQKYVASGNILLTDQYRSEGLMDWVPVSQVIGNIPVPAATQPAPAAPAAYAAP